MLVNFERKVCFLAHPKTASQTTTLTLREKSGFVPVTDHHHAWDRTYPSDRLEDMGLDADAARKWWCADHRQFVYLYVIRNPFDTLASWWEISKASIRYERIGPDWFKAWKALSPNAFPEEGLFAFVHREPPGPTGVIKYERLQDGLRVWAEFFRFPPPSPLPPIGITKGKAGDYRSYFDSESRAWVEDTFCKDLDAGGYTF